MDFFTEWITNIIIFVLIATVIDLLLPNSSMQKYTKMVMGLLLIVIILSPILKLLSTDFDAAIASMPSIDSLEQKNMENLIDLQKKEIQASQDAYILEEVAVQLKQTAEEELMDQYGLKISNIDLIMDEENQPNTEMQFQAIIVQLMEPEKEAEAVEVVRKVEINTSEPLPSNDETNETKKIASLLSERWNVEPETIQVVIGGGNT